MGVERISWFGENVRRKVGNDVHTLFWTDRWVGEVTLSVKFSRLYLLFDFKGKLVAEMLSLGWGEGGGAWKWWCQLFALEKELVEECRAVLLDVSLQVNNPDE